MRSALSDLSSGVLRVRNIAANISASAPQALKDPQLRERHETIQCACPVLLSGYLEVFLKDTAEAFIRDLCLLCRPFSTLPDRIQKQHFTEGAPLIAAKLAEKSWTAWITATHEDIARRLSSVCSPTSSYNLVWEAFANTRGNPGPEVVKDFLWSIAVLCG